MDVKQIKTATIELNHADILKIISEKLPIPDGAKIRVEIGAGYSVPINERANITFIIKEELK